MVILLRDHSEIRVVNPEAKRVRVLLPTTDVRIDLTQNPDVQIVGIPLLGQGPPGVGIPEVFVDSVPATLNFTPNGDGTYGIEVTM